MILKFAPLAACLVLAAAPAAASEKERLAGKTKVVCKRVQGTGWRLSNSSKVCKTKEEWTAISQETQKEYRDYGRTGSQGDLNGD